MRRNASVPSILGSLVLILAACSSAGPGSTDAPSTAPTDAPPATQSAPPVASLAPDAETYVANAAEFVAAADWDAKKTITIELAEMSFTPKDTVLKVGQPYVITALNKGTEKHEFTAAKFFPSVAFRKAEDASGEFKAPAPLEVEVFEGKAIELFLIPTKAGTYELRCEIEGHFEKGMFGTITVVAGS
jgi:uncharacterized cupredoxin-like copper-binding protein